MPISPMRPHPDPPEASSEGFLEICVLASGSRGNAVYVSDGATSVLVDAGLSGVEIERRMARRGLSPADLDAILVTHEHGDHARGVGVMARRYRLPVHLSDGTARAIDGRLGTIPEIRRFRAGEAFALGGLTVHPFATTHDAADPVGFTLASRGLRMGIATDLGTVTNLVRHHLRDCAALVLEANHDPEMLMNGPYPWHLKQRVRGRSGHLSNADARDLLMEIDHDRLRHIVLGHLSAENNRPDLALGTIREAMDRRGRSDRVSVAGQDEGSPRIRIGGSAAGNGTGPDPMGRARGCAIGRECPLSPDTGTEPEPTTRTEESNPAAGLRSPAAAMKFHTGHPNRLRRSLP
jgi:phosphoribosyl 1,2-cyclic phosphodiesterase